MDWKALFVAFLVGVVKAQQETCLSVEENPYFFFGTKTAYEFASQGISTTKHQNVPGCTPIAFWLLSRHGSHYPEEAEIAGLQALTNLKDNIATNWKNNQRHICPSDFNLLEKWQWVNVTRPGDLTTEGYMSTQRLAQAWKQKFPEVLDGNRYNYLFKYADDERSMNTFKAFTEGLFGAQAESYDIPREHNEKVLRPYKFCAEWLRSVEQNNDTVSQESIFKSKMEYKEMISNISKRLGFQYDFEEKFVQNMYDMCRYEKAKDLTQISPWCAAFTREDLKRLEYAEDLDTYYKYGYGSEINAKIGCSPIKAMMEFFISHSENATSQTPRAMIHLTEAPTLLMAATALGIHSDQVPLTGDNYHTTSMQSRKWTTSTVSPFNGNIAAVLYKCTANGNFQVKEQYQVLFLENEKPIYLEECRVGLCDWSVVKAKFGKVIEQCDLDICNSASKLSNVIGVTFVVIISFISYYVY